MVYPIILNREESQESTWWIMNVFKSLLWELQEIDKVHPSMLKLKQFLSILQQWNLHGHLILYDYYTRF